MITPVNFLQFNSNVAIHTTYSTEMGELLFLTASSAQQCFRSGMPPSFEDPLHWEMTATVNMKFGATPKQISIENGIIGAVPEMHLFPFFPDVYTNFMWFG